MTAATPQPPPVSDLECKVCEHVSSPHGAAWAGSGFTAPEGGVTAGQAAGEVRRAAFHGFLASQGYDAEDHGNFDQDEMELAFETGWQIAKAAPAAQDARPAPDQSRALLEEALFIRQNGERAPGGRENWRDWDDKTERFLRSLPADARPAPEYPHPDGDFIVIGPDCFAMPDGSVLSWRGQNYRPQPEQPAEALARPTTDGRTAVLLVDEIRAQSRPAPELAALRELLDEIGVMAANAPEDGDSFGLLEQIAMRVASADVPA